MKLTTEYTALGSINFERDQLSQFKPEARNDWWIARRTKLRNAAREIATEVTVCIRAAYQGEAF